jgi:anti-anti-sigma factor
MRSNERIHRQDCVATGVAAVLRRLVTVLYAEQRPARLVVAGEIDIATVGQFDEAVHTAATQLPRFVIDLSGARFVSAAGIRVLFAHRAHVVAVITAPGSIIARALTLSGYPTLTMLPAEEQRGVAGGVSA